jgi:hypothetical protein
VKDISYFHYPSCTDSIIDRVSNFHITSLWGSPFFQIYMEMSPSSITEEDLSNNCLFHALFQAKPVWRQSKTTNLPWVIHWIIAFHWIIMTFYVHCCCRFMKKSGFFPLKMMLAVLFICYEYFGQVIWPYIG